MNPILLRRSTAFEGHRRMGSGPLHEVALMAKASTSNSPIQVYDDTTGRVIDIDTRGSDDEVVARLELRLTEGPESAVAGERGRGRPKLGVVAREVTLLPRHWDWLNSQPGGASVALRRLVDEARRTSGDRDRMRAAQEAAYSFMSAAAGNLPGFEEAARALFAYDRRRFSELVSGWPADVRDYAIQLAFEDLSPVTG